MATGHACRCPQKSSTIGFVIYIYIIFNINSYYNVLVAPEGTYKHGVRSVFKDLIVKDGPLALYRGVTPIMIRAFPANAACFFGIELANKFFNLVAPSF